MTEKEKSFARRRGPGVQRSRSIAIALVVALAACKKSTDPALVIETAPVERRSIVLSAQANGTVEPIDIVEVKSKASGTIIKMPVDVGSKVKVGDLLVQIDPRTVQNAYTQAAADLSSSTVARAVALAQRNRSADLYQQKIITATEMEAATLAFANADAAVIKARTSLSTAKLQLDDATITAPTNGTVILRPVSVGTVITSASTAASGGTTILDMADLSKVRMRAFVNETDIGNVKAGQTATVTVDAFPTRRFVGIVEQVQPEAVVQSSVTMFPVLVSLDNSDGALMPGMNGQVVMDILRKDNVLAVPSDAIRIARDAATVAPVLGVSPDSLKAAQAAARAARGFGAGGTASSTASSGDTTGRRRFGAASSTPGALGGPGRGAGYGVIDWPARRWRWRWRWWWWWWCRRRRSGSGRNRPNRRRDVRVREEGSQILAARGAPRSQRFRLHRDPERRSARRAGRPARTRGAAGPARPTSGSRESRARVADSSNRPRRRRAPRAERVQLAELGGGGGGGRPPGN